MIRSASNHANSRWFAMIMAASYMPALILVTMSAFALRLVMLDAFPFREDEAAYAYWALHGWREDPLFLEVWPDKPPLFLWLLGGAFQIFGVSEASARFVNVAASTLTIPVVGATANRLWGRAAAMTAAIAITLSPYAISFAPTAYTDPLLLLFGMLAICLGVYGQAVWAGVMLGAAIMTKQQGLLLAPLVIGALWLQSADKATSRRQQARRIGWLAFGVASVALPILYWDSQRWATAPSPWDLSIRNYAAIELLHPNVWPESAAQWSLLIRELWTDWIGWSVIVSLITCGLAASLWDRRRNSSAAQSTAAALFLLWSTAFLILHIVTTIQPWDRYLLPLACMFALLTGWGMSRLSLLLPAHSIAVLCAILVLALAPTAQRAAVGDVAVGADHGDYAGLTEAVMAVREMNDGPFVLYHRTLGTHYRFYLHEAVAGDSHADAELRWFPSEVYLADNAAKTPYPPRYLVEPDWAPVRTLQPHLTMRGLMLTDHGRYGRFTVWQIQNQPAQPCEWCLSLATPDWLTHRMFDSVHSTPVQP